MLCFSAMSACCFCTESGTPPTYSEISPLYFFDGEKRVLGYRVSVGFMHRHRLLRRQRLHGQTTLWILGDVIVQIVDDPRVLLAFGVLSVLIILDLLPETMRLRIRHSDGC